MYERAANSAILVVYTSLHSREREEARGLRRGGRRWKTIATTLCKYAATDFLGLKCYYHSRTVPCGLMWPGGRRRGGRGLGGFTGWIVMAGDPPPPPVFGRFATVSPGWTFYARGCMFCFKRCLHITSPLSTTYRETFIEGLILAFPPQSAPFPLQLALAVSISISPYFFTIQ